MNYNKNMYPEGGYIFQNSDGVKFRGDGWKDLYRIVREYRERNGQPPGDPEAEISAWHCARTPGYCHGDAQPLPPPSPMHTVNGRVLNWFGTKLGEFRMFGRANRVAREEAGRRSAICAACPKQIAYSSACESCLNSVRSARAILLGEEGSVHKALHPCVVLGEDCQTSIHLTEPPSTDRDLPAHCWRK